MLKAALLYHAVHTTAKWHPPSSQVIINSALFAFVIIIGVTLGTRLGLRFGIKSWYASVFVPGMINCRIGYPCVCATLPLAAWSYDGLPTVGHGMVAALPTSNVPRAGVPHHYYLCAVRKPRRALHHHRPLLHRIDSRQHCWFAHAADTAHAGGICWLPDHVHKPWVHCTGNGGAGRVDDFTAVVRIGPTCLVPVYFRSF